MAHVWVRARKDFTHAGRSYAVGQTFQAPTLVAVQMKASRSVEFAMAPKPAEATVAAAAPVAPRRRRSVAQRPEVQPHPIDAVEAPPVVETAPEVHPMEPSSLSDVIRSPQDIETGTYARKDLRAED